MNDELKRKVLKIAAEVCWMHGRIAGNRICQDWSEDTAVLDALTPEERDQLMYQFEQYNSNGDDYYPGEFPYDEMVISFAIARALEVMVGEAKE